MERLLNGEVIHRQAVDYEGETRITMVGEDVKSFDVRGAKPLVGLARLLGRRNPLSSISRFWVEVRRRDGQERK